MRRVGAEITIDYRNEDFVDVVRSAGGADVILDIMGAAYLDRNIDALADDGRLVIIGMQGGAKAELNIGKLLAKRGGVIATALRARPVGGPGGKSDIVSRVIDDVWPMVADGLVRPVIGAEFPMAEAQAAHELLESGGTWRAKCFCALTNSVIGLSRATPAPAPAGRPRRWCCSARDRWSPHHRCR